jgi:hypothetical protein
VCVYVCVHVHVCMYECTRSLAGVVRKICVTSSQIVYDKGIAMESMQCTSGVLELSEVEIRAPDFSKYVQFVTIISRTKLFCPLVLRALVLHVHVRSVLYSCSSYRYNHAYG